MKCKVLSLYNTKGGVGKTTTAVNLAYLAAQEGQKVLLWDLDTQASATFFCGGKAKVRGGVKKLIRRKTETHKVIRDTPHENLWIIPADGSNRNIDLIVNDEKDSKKALQKVIKDVSGDLDLVVLDSPPGLSVLSESIFFASDVLLVPTIPSTLSIRTLELIDEHYASKELKQKQIIPFFSMADLRKKMHRELIEIYARDPRFLSVVIPNASIIEQMGARQAPLLAFNRSSKASKNYLELWAELGRKGGL
jgi:chromosome partitioning protein